MLEDYRVNYSLLFIICRQKFGHSNIQVVSTYFVRREFLSWKLPQILTIQKSWFRGPPSAQLVKEPVSEGSKTTNSFWHPFLQHANLDEVKKLFRLFLAKLLFIVLQSATILPPLGGSSLLYMYKCKLKTQAYRKSLKETRPWKRPALEWDPQF